MSNTDLIIPERSRDIGDFLVGRLLPFRSKRMVGPFIFIDHMGPSIVGPGKYMDVDRHPHIGLATLTYLFKGEIHHRDSLGSDQIISPGSVNLMSAGAGVTHTERTPEHLRNGSTHQIHGFQIWIALPKEKEFMPPEFHHIEANRLPAWSENALQITLVAGSAYGRTAPAPVYSSLFMLEVISKEPAALETGSNLTGEIGICVVNGNIEACDKKIEAGHLLVSKANDSCSLKLGADTRLLIFGGQPLPEKRFIDWNFVASDRETLKAARERWLRDDFPKIENDTTYIPLPKAPNLRSKTSS